jgi:hypothetical protein
MTFPAVNRATTRRLSPGLVLAGGAVTLLAVRLLVSLARSGPVIMADEAGYLMHARVLAGGLPAQMGSSPFYRGGYSLLLAPVLSVAGDPVTAYHGVLVVNAALAACIVPLLYLLLTRCVHAGRLEAAWGAVAGGAYPSITAFSQVALAENVLLPLTIVWLLCAGSLVGHAGRGTAVVSSVGAGLCAGALWTAHGRMIVIVALTCALLPALAIVRRRAGDLAAAAAGFAALGAGLVSGALLNHWLLVKNYGGTSPDELSQMSSGFHHVGGAVENLVAQSWYLLVATLGLVLLLCAGDVPAATRRVRRRGADAADAVLLLTVLATAGLLVESALWFATRTRPDQLLYGRYAEATAPVLVGIAVAGLARPGPAPRVRRLLLGFATLTLLVALVRAGLHLPEPTSRWNVASLPSVTRDLGAPVIVAAGAVMTAALALILAVRRRAPGAVGPLVVLLFAPTTAYLVALPVLRSQHDVYPSGWTSPRSAVEASGATRVGYDLGHLDHIAVKAYQWSMPHTRFVLFDSSTQAPPTASFFGARRLTGRSRACRASTVWRDPGRDQVLWNASGEACTIPRR